MAWTESFLAKRREAWIKAIAKAQYYAGGKWYDGSITLKEVNGTNCIIRFVTTDSSKLTITQLRLIDVAGDVAFSESRTMTKNADQGVLIQISVPIIES